MNVFELQIEFGDACPHQGCKVFQRCLVRIEGRGGVEFSLRQQRILEQDLSLFLPAQGPGMQ